MNESIARLGTGRPRGEAACRHPDATAEPRTDRRLRRLYRPGAFFALDLALTWGPLWFLVIAQRSGWLEESFALLALAGGSAMISAAVFVHLTRAPGFARDFWLRAIDPRRIGPGWWPVILVLQLAINVLAVVLSLPLGGDPAQLHLAQAFTTAPLAFLAWMLVFGPIPEELGWRGYGLDALRTRMSLLWASIVLGLIWALWHLPLVFVEGTFQRGLLAYPPALAAYFLAFVPTSILMGWIYYRTNRSTLSAILFHFAGNAAGEMLPLELPTRVIQAGITALIAVAVVAANRSLFTRREFWIDAGLARPAQQEG